MFLTKMLLTKMTMMFLTTFLMMMLLMKMLLITLLILALLIIRRLTCTWPLSCLPIDRSSALPGVTASVAIGCSSAPPGVAAACEEPLGETAQKMAEWKALTKRTFELRTLEGLGHFNILQPVRGSSTTTTPLYDALLCDMMDKRSGSFMKCGI